MSSEAQGPDISKLIDNAKEELETMPKILPDEHEGIDPPSGEEPPNAKALRERMAQNMTKPPSEPTKVEVVVKPKPKSLDSIRWALIPTGDARTEESPALGEHFHVQTDEERKADLSARAEAYNSTKQKQYFLHGQVLGRFGSFYRGLSRAVNGTMPEELQAMLVLSGDYGYGIESDSYAEQVHYAAASALRKDVNGDSSSWRGIDGYIPQGAAKAVLEKAQQAKQGVPLTEDDLTRCMLTALACGGPLQALEMASLGRRYVKPSRFEKESDTYDAGKAVLTKLTTKYGEHSFDRAYALSPESTRRRIDAEFATLEQNPKYADLLQYPGVPLLIEKAKSRMNERLHREQSRWYEAQKVRDVSALEAALDSEHLRSLSEQTAIEGGHFEVIEAEISKRSQEVVDGKVANMIGAELVRRLHPEHSIANVETALKAKALGGAGRVPAYYPSNEFVSIFGYTKETQLSPAERQKKVQDIPVTSTAMEEVVSREFDWRGEERLKSLVALLKSPSYFTYVLGNETRGKTDVAMAQATREQIARALIQGITFLQTISEDEYVRNIAERELGLVGYLTPGDEGALGKAQAELRKTFADQKDDQSGLTLYDTLLAEGQIERDAEVVGLIAHASTEEARALSVVKIENVKGILSSQIEAVSEELRELLKKNTELEGMKQKLANAEAKKTELANQKAATDALVVADSWVDRKLHPDRPTTTVKLSKQTAIAASMLENDADIEMFQGEVDKMTDITPNRVALAQKKAEGIARLAKQAHAVE